MAELPDISGGETITSAFTNDVKNRTVMRYANAAARAASIPVPIAGNLAFLTDVGEVTVYDGAAWQTLLDVTDGDNRYVNDTGDTMTGPLIQTAEGRVLAADAGDVLVRWNGDGNSDVGNRRFEWRRSADFGELELWGYDASNVGGIIFTLSANPNAKHLNSRGFIAELYANLPAPGKDKYWFQMRNMTVTDTAPGGGDGIDGDVWVQTGASNRVWGKVEGVWA